MVPILGDTTAPNLGMSDKDRELICETTTVVFHGAASVKFDDSLREAVHNNLKSTRDLVELGLKIKNIKVEVDRLLTRTLFHLFRFSSTYLRGTPTASA